MKPLEQWLNEYAADHVNPSNQRIHLVCVPLIYFSVAGLLHYIPYFIGDLIIGLAVVWYSFLGMKALLIMIAQVTVCVAIAEAIRFSCPAYDAFILYGIFGAAWIGQFYGHHLEGRRPSFFRDLQYLLIGPLWVWLGKHGSK